MRSAAKIAALALLVAWCAGCGRKAPQVQPAPEAEAPSLPPAQMALLIPPVPPPLPTVAERAVKLDTSTPPESEASAAHTRPRRIFRRKPKSADNPPQEASKTPAAPETQIASGQLPSEQSPIGQLSTANGGANTADRRTLIDLINSIENGLNAIHHPLSSDEQKTAAQVRTFITRARDALKIDDLDGAHTLATKAHLLLQELTKQ